MNLLIYDRSELCGDRLELSDFRAEHLLGVLKAQAGMEIRVGEIGGGVGVGEVLEVGESTLKLKVELTKAPLPSMPCRLIIALPRPQTMKKVLSVAAQFGVEELVFCGGVRVEKSYFSSQVLRGREFERYLIEGLSQSGGSTLLPKFRIERRLSGALEGLTDGSSIKLIAHPGSSPTLFGRMRELMGSNLETSGIKLPFTLALGPEGGWVPSEIKQFVERGFYEFNLGERILRLEVALAAVLGQVSILTEMIPILGASVSEE